MNRNLLLVALVLFPTITMAAKVEMPEWEENQNADGFFLGGGLWPEGLIPDKDAADQQTAANSTAGATPTTGSDVGAAEAAKFYGPQGLVESGVAGETPPSRIPTAATPPAVGVAETEVPAPPIEANMETPALEPLPEIKGELKNTYFAYPPVDYLVDPQRLLTEQKSNDIKRFLEFHSDESNFQIYVMVLGETQTIPDDIDVKKLHKEWFSEQPTVLMFYYREQPEMTELVYNDSVRSQLPLSVFERIRQNCLREGGATDDAPDQVEKMAIELSIQLYWLTRLMEHEGDAAKAAAAETPIHEMEASADAPELLREYAPGIFIEDSSSIVAFAITVLEIILLVVLLGAAGLFVIWLRGRDSVSGKPLLFPNFRIVPRLGGEYSGGGFVSMSFEMNEGSNSYH